MPPPQDNARLVFLIILILWLNTGPDPNAPGGLLAAPALVAARLERQRAAHNILNSTRWGDFAPRQNDDGPEAKPIYLDVTGFREADGYAWDDLGRFRKRCAEWARNGNPPVDGQDGWEAGLAAPTWMNATGVVHGSWVRRPGTRPRGGDFDHYNLSAIEPGVEWLGVQNEFARNMTGTEGKVTLRIEDRENDFSYDEAAVEGEPRSGGLVREVDASVTLEDVVGSGTAYDMRLHGVHWPRQGAMLLTTTSEKFAGIFGLPHLTPGVSFFRSSRQILNETVDAVLRKKEKQRFFDASNPWTSTPEGVQEGWNPVPHCEYVMYVQVHPLDARQQKTSFEGWKGSERQAGLIEQMEKELRFPTGAPLLGVPVMQMSTVLWSPDCSYFLESIGPPGFTPAEGQHLVGWKQEVFTYEANTWLLAFGLVLCGQVLLLKKQMKESYTPSTLGRISFYTTAMMLMADGLVFWSASAWSLSASTTFLPSLIVTFGGFMATLIGGSLLAEVYKAQEPERRAREREREQQRERQQTSSSSSSSPATSQTPTAANAIPTQDSLPRPVTAPPLQPDSPPIIIPSDQDIAAEIAAQTATSAAAIRPRNLPPIGTQPQPPQTAYQALTTFSTLMGRFIIIDALLLFLSLAATSWWASVRIAYCNILAGIYLSFWVPQIVRNVQRNSRRAFSWPFMIGQSVLRIMPIAYFWLRQENILFAQPDWVSFACLAGWLWVQLWILAFQDVLGPRVGIPKSWTSEAWDYHPVLREDALEAGGLPIGLMSQPSGSDELSDGRPRAISHSHDDERGKDKEKQPTSQMRPIDCAICCETLEVPVIKAGEDDPAITGVSGVFLRRQYMVTPCRHIFHTKCLEGWLRFRLQCPICREELPPL